MEKKGDHRVLFLVLFTLLAFGIATLFVARQNLEQQSSQRNSRATQSQRAGAHGTDFGPYMEALQKRIKRSWFPPDNTESLKGMVIFKMHNDGSVSNVRILKSTGLAVADLAMIKAVHSGAPFGALPPGAPANVDVEFSFDYNVLNGGSRSSTASPVK